MSFPYVKDGTTYWVEVESCAGSHEAFNLWIVFFLIIIMLIGIIKRRRQMED